MFVLLDCVSGLVTTTLCVPVSAGVAAVKEVELPKTTFVAGTPPMLTVAPSIKPLPVMVIVVLPTGGPPIGDTDDTTGLPAARSGRARKREEPITRIIKNTDMRNFLFITAPFLRLNY
jgi:hypothetical protein